MSMLVEITSRRHLAGDRGLMWVIESTSNLGLSWRAVPSTAVTLSVLAGSVAGRLHHLHLFMSVFKCCVHQEI